jgi:hypothetical protein
MGSQSWPTRNFDPSLAAWLRLHCCGVPLHRIGPEKGCCIHIATGAVDNAALWGRYTRARQKPLRKLLVRYEPGPPQTAPCYIVDVLP